jgi:hypothetical protein
MTSMNLVIKNMALLADIGQHAWVLCEMELQLLTYLPPKVHHAR